MIDTIIAIIGFAAVGISVCVAVIAIGHTAWR